MRTRIDARSHCHFVCLIRNRIFLAGSTPKGGLTEITPTTQAARHPRALSHFLFPLPPYFCHASCIRSVRTLPCPVHITYRVSGLSLPCFPVLHIYSNPTERNPSTHIKPHKQAMLIHYFNKQIKTAVYHYLVFTIVSSVPTCSSAPHLHQ